MDLYMLGSRNKDMDIGTGSWQLKKGVNNNQKSKLVKSLVSLAKYFWKVGADRSGDRAAKTGDKDS